LASKIPPAAYRSAPRIVAYPSKTCLVSSCHYIPFQVAFGPMTSEQNRRAHPDWVPVGDHSRTPARTEISSRQSTITNRTADAAALLRMNGRIDKTHRRPAAGSFWSRSHVVANSSCHLNVAANSCLISDLYEARDLRAKTTANMNSAAAMATECGCFAPIKCQNIIQNRPRTAASTALRNDRM